MACRSSDRVIFLTVVPFLEEDCVRYSNRTRTDPPTERDCKIADAGFQFNTSLWGFNPIQNDR